MSQEVRFPFMRYPNESSKKKIPVPWTLPVKLKTPSPGRTALLLM